MKKTKNELLRMAVLGVPGEPLETTRQLTVQDVDRKWPQLAEVGFSAYDVRVKANSDDESLISDELMTQFMDALNWCNHFHS